MSDEPVTKLTVGFERKKDLTAYNNATASAYLSVELGPDDDAAAINKKLQDNFSLLKAAVYDELGIECIMDEANVLREKFMPAVTVTEQGEQNLRRATGATGGFDTGGLQVANPDKMTQDIPADIVAKCNAVGITKVWANTGKFGQFYKEHVAEGEQPKLMQEDGRAAIIKP